MFIIELPDNKTYCCLWNLEYSPRESRSQSYKGCTSRFKVIVIHAGWDSSVDLMCKHNRDRMMIMFHCSIQEMEA